MIFVIQTISMIVRACKFVNVSGPRGAGSQEDGNSPNNEREISVLYNGVKDPNTGEPQGHSLDKDALDLLINYIANRVWWRS